MEKIATQNNYIGRMLYYIGLAAIILGVAGFLLSIGNVLEVMEYSGELGALFLSTAIGMPAVGVVAGFLFFGFSEVIRLLDRESNSDGDANIPGQLPKL